MSPVALAGTAPTASTKAARCGWLADVVGMFGRVHGTFAEFSDAVEKVAGRSPRTVKEFIAEHADQWRA